MDIGRITLYKKTMQKWATCLALLVLLVPWSNSHADASDASPSNASASILKLQHEPIQPILPAKNLNPDKVTLGETLFHDTRLGRDNDMSCASCHLLHDNGANHRHHTLGRNGVELDVNTPTVFNSSLNHQLFWDGRAMNLQAQINFVVENKKEFASSWPEIVKKLKQDKSYVIAFNKIYADGISADSIRDAIVTFERSLMTINSRFDHYLLGDADAISNDEKEGYHLFKSYGCIVCHQGSNVGGNLFMKIGVFGNFFAGRREQTKADLGRYNVTGDEADRYVFRVPSLRLAALTSPYFHDGSVKTLKQAVKIMARHQLGREIPDQDIAYIVKFLKTLPGEYKGQPLRKEHKPQKTDNKP